MEYIVEASFNCYDKDVDRLLYRLIRRDDSGSGYDFHSNRRDICWVYTRQHAALKAVEKIKKAKPQFKGLGLKVCLYETE